MTKTSEQSHFAVSGSGEFLSQYLWPTTCCTSWLISYISYQFMVFQAKSYITPKVFFIVIIVWICSSKFLHVQRICFNWCQPLHFYKFLNTDKNPWKWESQALERQPTWHHTWYARGKINMEPEIDFGKRKEESHHPNHDFLVLC